MHIIEPILNKITENAKIIYVLKAKYDSVLYAHIEDNKTFSHWSSYGDDEIEIHGEYYKGYGEYDRSNYTISLYNLLDNFEIFKKNLEEEIIEAKEIIRKNDEENKIRQNEEERKKYEKLKKKYEI